MKFLCDVHISYKIVNHLILLGFECIHVNGILNKWNTSDRDICSYADSNDYTIITKDVDFRDSFLISNTPKKLIKINLGNISNIELIEIIEANIDAIIKLDIHSNFMIEVDKLRLSYIVK
jgi:predicted nuclease of predicted toxin-antitoxin system